MGFTVKTNGNGDSEDYLDGEPLRGGDRIVVDFEDGTPRVGFVTIRKYEETESAHNDRWTSSHHAADLSLQFGNIIVRFAMRDNPNLKYRRSE